ncbi:unnamed protein product [Polarella glacialis]|uniref:NHR domain-containing protein n=1 Tax=Polarella glacialis TaxID=89957 RepID=A0A813H7D7_POLGL|nr:unnamed protein product [Polarella glacialis]
MAQRQNSHPGSSSDQALGVGFHRRATSDSLLLSGPGQAVATRKGIPRGIAVGRAPCPYQAASCGWGFTVAILAVEDTQHFTSGLWVGFTATSPVAFAELRTGRGVAVDFAADVPDSCVAGGEGVLWNGVECLEVPWDTGALCEGDEVSAFISSSGEFYVRVKGKTVASGVKVKIPLRGQLYPLVELRGRTKAVQLISQGSGGKSGDGLPNQWEARRSPALSVASPPSQRGGLGLFASSGSASGRRESPSLQPSTSPSSSGGASAGRRVEDMPRTPPHAHTPLQGFKPKMRSLPEAAGVEPSTLRKDQGRPEEELERERARHQEHRNSRAPQGAPPRAASGPGGGRPEKERRANSGQRSPSARPLVTNRAQLRNGSSPPTLTSELISETAFRLQQKEDNAEQIRVWATVRNCLAKPSLHVEDIYGVCLALVASSSKCESLEQRLTEAEKTLAITLAEGKRKDLEIRQLRKDSELKTAKMEESNSACKALAQNVTEAQAAKNRAQHQTQQLRTKLGSKDLANAWIVTGESQGSSSRRSRSASALNSVGLRAATDKAAAPLRRAGQDGGAGALPSNLPSQQQHQQQQQQQQHLPSHEAPQQQQQQPQQSHQVLQQQQQQHQDTSHQNTLHQQPAQQSHQVLQHEPHNPHLHQQLQQPPQELHNQHALHQPKFQDQNTAELQDHNYKHSLQQQPHEPQHEPQHQNQPLHQTNQDQSQHESHHQLLHNTLQQPQHEPHQWPLHQVHQQALPQPHHQQHQLQSHQLKQQQDQQQESYPHQHQLIQQHTEGQVMSQQHHQRIQHQNHSDEPHSLGSLEHQESKDHQVPLHQQTRQQNHEQFHHHVQHNDQLKHATGNHPDQAQHLQVQQQQQHQLEQAWQQPPVQISTEEWHWKSYTGELSQVHTQPHLQLPHKQQHQQPQQQHQQQQQQQQQPQAQQQAEPTSQLSQLMYKQQQEQQHLSQLIQQQQEQQHLSQLIEQQQPQQQQQQQHEHMSQEEPQQQQHRPQQQQQQHHHQQPQQQPQQHHVLREQQQQPGEHRYQQWVQGWPDYLPLVAAGSGGQ